MTSKQFRVRRHPHGSRASCPFEPIRHTHISHHPAYQCLHGIHKAA